MAKKAARKGESVEQRLIDLFNELTEGMDPEEAAGLALEIAGSLKIHAEGLQQEAAEAQRQ